MEHESPIACDLTALDPERRARRQALGAQLAAARAEFVTLEARRA